MTTTSFSGPIWAIVVIGGFLVLGAAIAWAMWRNRTTPEQDRRSDRASRDYYQQRNAEDEARTP